jgi:hypothetical protein
VIVIDEIIGFAVEVTDWLSGAVAVWRYLFSHGYRRKIHARWRTEGAARAVLEVVCAVAGLAFTIAVLAALVWVFVA